jgi:hypothetical protein
VKVIGPVEDAMAGGHGDKDCVGQGVANFPGAGRVATIGKVAPQTGHRAIVVVLQTERKEKILLRFLFGSPVEGDRQGVSGGDIGGSVKTGQRKTVGKGEVVAEGDR